MGKNKLGGDTMDKNKLNQLHSSKNNRERIMANKDSEKRYDTPDMLNTEKQSIYDMHEDMQTVDAVPMEELNDQVKDEKDKSHTKDTSGSERKYK